MCGCDLGVRVCMLVRVLSLCPPRCVSVRETLCRMSVTCFGVNVSESVHMHMCEHVSAHGF